MYDGERRVNTGFCWLQWAKEMHSYIWSMAYFPIALNFAAIVGTLQKNILNMLFPFVKENSFEKIYEKILSGILVQNS